jgi:hypothetical protein
LNKLFPVLCVDNFYNNPDEIREFALSLNYDNPLNSTGYWTGEQTNSLHIDYPDFFASFSKRFFSLYYDFNATGPINWVLETKFNKVYPFSNQNNLGWIHSDHNAILAGIIYLNKTPVNDQGTALYDLNDGIDYLDYVENVKSLEQERYALFKHSSGILPIDFDNESYNQAVTNNNNMFTETTRFKNKYNRLISYPGSQYHAATSTHIPGEPFRLTQLIFVKNLHAPGTPLERSSNVDIIL